MSDGNLTSSKRGEKMTGASFWITKQGDLLQAWDILRAQSEYELAEAVARRMNEVSVEITRAKTENVQLARINW